MKKLFVMLAMSLLCVTSYAETDASPINAEGVGAWACVLKFEGVSKGIQVIVGKFKTNAYGKITCVGARGEKLVQRIKMEMNSKIVGLTVGVGYFKMRGVSSEISLFNESPSKLFGKYNVTHYEAAAGVGAGYFTATKFGLPQFAYNISYQFMTGAGVKVGLERMKISAISESQQAEEEMEEL